MAQANVPLKQAGFLQTNRRDAWWVAPLLTLLIFGGFLVYAHFRVFEGKYYYLAAQGANYLSPFYSPLVFDQPGHHSGHAWMKEKPSWLPGWISPAALILIFPAGFRFTCYYYRGAYYKAFWGDPPSCAVGEPRKTYWGEHSLPLLLQNIHRYFLYFALIFIFILAYDAWSAMWFRDDAGQWRFGVGVGTLVLTANVVLLGGYTLGCHSLRHLVGGGKDCLSSSPGRSAAYNCVSCLNRKHMVWAWMSLFWVAFSDLYVRMCAMGVWSDWRIF